MRRHRFISRRWLAGGLVIAAVSFPAAAQAEFQVAPAGGVYRPATLAASGHSVRTTAPGTQSRFDWGDAGIGAAGALVLLGAGVGASGVARRHQGRSPVAG
jgi:hypothetical protein